MDASLTHGLDGWQAAPIPISHPRALCFKNPALLAPRGPRAVCVQLKHQEHDQLCRTALSVDGRGRVVKQELWVKEQDGGGGLGVRSRVTRAGWGSG